MLALAPWTVVFAATSVSAVDHKTSANGDVLITLQTSGDVPRVSVFATESQPRIVLDLEERAATALSAVSSDTGSVDVTVVGRDAVATGTVAGTADIDAIVTALERVDGVRVVDVTGVVVEAGTTG